MISFFFYFNDGLAPHTVQAFFLSEFLKPKNNYLTTGSVLEFKEN
jgi:hypothetical protein